MKDQTFVVDDLKLDGVAQLHMGKTDDWSEMLPIKYVLLNLSICYQDL